MFSVVLLHSQCYSASWVNMSNYKLNNPDDWNAVAFSSEYSKYIKKLSGYLSLINDFLLYLIEQSISEVFPQEVLHISLIWALQKLFCLCGIIYIVSAS